MSNNKENDTGFTSSCLGGCLSFLAGLPISAITAVFAMQKSLERHEKRCEINPNCNEIIGFSRTVSAGTNGFLLVCIVNYLIGFIIMRLIFAKINNLRK